MATVETEQPAALHPSGGSLNFHRGPATELKGKMKHVFTLTAVIGLIAAACYLVPAKPMPTKQLTFDQVQTTDSTVYSYTPKVASSQFVEKSGYDNSEAVRVAGAQFVEKVDPLTQDQLKSAVAVFGRTMRPTPPPARVVWINKRTSLSGEGVVIR